MASDLRHKTPEQLRAEIMYQDRMITTHDASIQGMEKRLADAEALVEATKASLSKQRMTRHNHYQRLVWAKNYLVMKGEG